MRLSEANIHPAQDFIDEVELLVDDSLEEYQEYLDSNNDTDDIDELESILTSNNVDELPIEFITDHSKRKDPDEWLSAAADWTKEEGNTIRIFLHAPNLNGTYGPKTFKKMLMGLLAHETIHWGQYDRMGGDILNNYKSGHMKGVELFKKSGKSRDWMRSYLRDPHELMAYAHGLAEHMKELDNPEDGLRNPEKYINDLPIYKQYRDVFPANSKQIKQLLTYTAGYFQKT